MPNYANYDKNYILSRIVIAENGCWNWQRAVGSHGYGALSRGRLAHRIAYEIFIGPIPEWNLVLHTCDNPLCCNPEHLFLGAHIDNTADMIRKGRMIIPPPKLTAEEVQAIKAKLAKGETQDKIAKQHNISQAQISRINTGQQRNNG